jgi:2-phospho-L-lactate/phosphoenolpyruvate guanylyltransferase
MVLEANHACSRKGRLLRGTTGWRTSSPSTVPALSGNEWPPRRREAALSGNEHDLERSAVAQRSAGRAHWQDWAVSEPGWWLVLAVKRLSAGKSRLRGAVPGVPHERLALALVLDTVGAVLACPDVRGALVVTDDAAVAQAVRAAGAEVAVDRPRAGLNEAFAHGASLVPGWTAALTADLPALRPTELGGVLRAAAQRAGRSFVADAKGSGTVLLAASPGVRLEPRFGPGSAAAHAASGARRLAGRWPTVRRDVDTPADLAAAIDLGVGRNTADLACPSGAPTGR